MSTSLDFNIRTSSSCSDSESPSPQNTPDERLLPGGVGVKDGDLQRFCILLVKTIPMVTVTILFFTNVLYTNSLVFGQELEKYFLSFG